MKSSIIATLWELRYGKHKDPIRERQFYESILRQKHNSKSNKNNLGNTTVYFMSITRDSNSTENLRSAGHSFYLLSPSMLHVKGI